MSELELMARLPDVTSVVRCDLSGTHLESAREPDGEGVAAVAGFVGATLLEVGEQLGLGPLKAVRLAAPSRARIILLRAHGVLTATVEPAVNLAAVERALEGLG